MNHDDEWPRFYRLGLDFFAPNEALPQARALPPTIMGILSASNANTPLKSKARRWLKDAAKPAQQQQHAQMPSTPIASSESPAQQPPSPTLLGRAELRFEQPGKLGITFQDTSGRLWDVLRMLRYGITQAKDHGGEILFELHVRNDNRAAKKVTLKAVCGPGDNAEPVITVMLPDED